jgi:hypothetical protein
MIPPSNTVLVCLVFLSSLIEFGLSFESPRFTPPALRGSCHGPPSTLLRCSIPPMPSEPVHDAIRSPICVTSADYIATIPLWERELLAHATKEFCPDSSLYDLLQQRNVDILVAGDGGHKDDYGSFG